MQDKMPVNYPKIGGIQAESQDHLEMLLAFFPERKFRKWTYMEVPVGKVIRRKTFDRGRRLITGSDWPDIVHLGHEMVTTQQLVDSYIDDNGEPCGVEVQ